MAFRTSATSIDTGVLGSNASLNIDVGSGNNRIVMVGVAAVDGQAQATLDSVQVDGVNCTQAGSTITVTAAGNYAHVSLWYMLDADLPAGTGNFGVTTSWTEGSNNEVSEIWTHAALFDGLAQQAPEATANDNSSAEVTETPSVNITTASANAMIYGFGGFSYANASIGLGAGANYTLLNSQQGSFNQGFIPAKFGTFADEYDLDAGTAGVKAVDLTSATGWWQMTAAAFEVAAAGSPPAVGGPNMDAAIMMGTFF